jgi:ABC-type multidrug transport system fused ATPase/permease subunit
MISGWADIIQYFRVMDTESDIKTVNNPVEMSTLNGEVVFDSVFFSYPGSEENSLNGISFKIEPGQKVGIVGPTGSGKTTLLSMLQIAYLPDIGSIRVDGIDLSNVNQSEYRSNIGFIEQHPLILSQSLKKNMLFGLSKEQRINVSDKDLENVLDRLKLSDLKHRLNKNVGELGIKLSGGQKQRIIIARVLLKKPEMLIVDEGTSAVDPVTEKIIHDELDNLSPGSTRIFVAHRISTVQNSDKIIVMQDGSIEAIGTHDELLESCVLYQELVQNLLLSF